MSTWHRLKYQASWQEERRDWAVFISFALEREAQPRRASRLAFKRSERLVVLSRAEATKRRLKWQACDRQEQQLSGCTRCWLDFLWEELKGIQCPDWVWGYHLFQYCRCWLDVCSLCVALATKILSQPKLFRIAHCVFESDRINLLQLGVMTTWPLTINDLIWAWLHAAECPLYVKINVFDVNFC